MSVPYDLFTGAFLSKISEFDFIQLEEKDRTAMQWRLDIQEWRVCKLCSNA